MLLDKYINVNINSSNIKWFKSKGYDVKWGQKYDVDVSDLRETSHTKVLVKCEICGAEKYTPYREYILSISNGGYYCCCAKCAMKKNKKTNLERYGVENVFKSEIHKDKIKKTNLERYGYESHNLNNIVKENKKNTKLEKYGDENYNNMEKNKQTCLEKYGVEYVLQNKEIKDKIKKTNLERYGVEHNMQYEEIKQKMIETRIKNEKAIPKEYNDLYLEYRRLVENYTRRNKNVLYEKWNGFDYYDNKYIKDNKDYKLNNKEYP